MEEKILKAIHRIEELYFKTNGQCYVSFSGGKDSTVVLALIKMSVDSMVLPQEGIKAVFVDTGIELQATVDFVKWCKSNWYQNIDIIKPEKSFGWIINNKGKPLKSKMKAPYLNAIYNHKETESMRRYILYGKTNSGKELRKMKLADKDMHMIHPLFEIEATADCCKYMKKKPFYRYNKEHNMKGALQGIRLQEGGARQMNAKRRVDAGGQLCTFTRNGIIIKAPIIDWTDKDVDDFINNYNVPLSDAYNKYGMTRTGCMGCPFALDINKNLEILYKYEPKKYKASMFFLKDVYIAQNVKLPFDADYEKERKEKWIKDYEPMRQEMLRKYRPKSRLIKDYEQTNIYDYLEEK